MLRNREAEGWQSVRQAQGGYLTPKTPCSGCKWDTGTKTSVVCTACQAERGQGSTIKGKKDIGQPKAGKEAKKGNSGRKGPNKTESEYGMRLKAEYSPCRIIFEGLTLRMNNGHKYTPDWIVICNGWILCVEVKARGKNGFRFASYGRAKLAFDQVKLDWPMFEFRWAEKSKGSWIVK